MIRQLAAWVSSQPGRRVARRIFWCFAAVLFTLTHWPALEIPSPIPRTDILLHMSFFGPWMFLCTACGWFGPFLSRRNIWINCIVALAYAGFDESTQAFSFIRRHAGWDDFGANALGILTATAVLLILSRTISKQPQTVGTPPIN